MKFIHCADIHLDSPFSGLSLRRDAPRERLRFASRKAFIALVDRALAEPVDFVIIAGDLFDGDWRDFNTGLFFVREAARLNQAGIPLFLLLGNHDAASSISKKLPDPPNVNRFPHKRPGLFRLDHLGVALHGQSFPQREVWENLAGDYPPPIKGLFNIGVLHTCAEGAPGHVPYAPCSVKTLAAHGYDYWALGHAHRRALLHEDPPVLFSGVLQGRHIRETGPKGFYLISVPDRRIEAIEFVAVDTVRWERLTVDVSASRTGEEAVEQAGVALEAALVKAEGRLLCLRLALSGRSAAHAALQADPEQWLAECQARAEVLSGDLWIEKVLVETKPERDLEQARQRQDASGILLRSLAEVSQDPAFVETLQNALGPIFAKIPASAWSSPGARGAPTGEALTKILEDAQELLALRLLETGSDDAH